MEKVKILRRNSPTDLHSKAVVLNSFEAMDHQPNKKQCCGPFEF